MLYSSNSLTRSNAITEYNHFIDRQNDDRSIKHQVIALVGTIAASAIACVGLAFAGIALCTIAFIASCFIIPALPICVITILSICALVSDEAKDNDQFNAFKDEFGHDRELYPREIGKLFKEGDDQFKINLLQQLNEFQLEAAKKALGLREYERLNVIDKT